MEEMNVICDIAKKLLVMPAITGKKDNFILDRTLRIVRNTDLICQLPEILGGRVSIDREPLTIASWFADTGITMYIKDKNLSLLTAEINTTEIREFSTKIVSQKLSGKLSNSMIDKVNKIILESNNRFANITEAIVLSDSRSLEDLGIVGIINELKKNISSGRGIADILQSWQKKIDYHYWQTRLKEGFHLDSVRKIAVKRLQSAQLFMDSLCEENDSVDIKKLIAKGLPQQQAVGV